MHKFTCAVLAASLFIISVPLQAAQVCNNYDLDWSQYTQFNDDNSTIYPFTATAVDIDGSTLDVSVRIEREGRDNIHVAAPSTSFPGVVDEYMNNPEVYRYWRLSDTVIDTLTYDFSEDVTLNLFMFGGHRPSAGNFAYAELTFWDGPDGTGNKVTSLHSSGANSATVLAAVGDPTTAAINVLPLSAGPNFPSTFLSTTDSYTMVSYDVGFPPRPWTVLDMGGAVVRSITWDIYGSSVDVSPQLLGSGSNGDESRDVSTARANILSMNISAYFGNFNFDICENNDQLSLGDYVWYDSDRNGIQDVGESGVNGVTVNLYANASCSGAPAETTMTVHNGSDGFYEFNPLSTGDYCVEFIAPAGHSISPTGQGTGSTDSNADPATGQVLNIDLHTVDQTIDMGVFVPGSVSGLVWCESGTSPNITYDFADADVLQNGIGVTLYEDTNCNDSLDGVEAATALSQDTVAGVYSFGNLITGGPGAGDNPPGCYLVQIDVADPDLGVCDNPITPSILSPDIDAPNPDNSGNDFGHNEEISLGNFVWYDSNQDGIQDLNEAGINNITVDLYTNATCTGASSQTTATASGGLPAADGWYEFSPLASGSYCIEFSNIPSGWVFTQQNQGGNNAVDSDTDPGTGQITDIDLQNNDPDEDSGIYAAIGTIPGNMFCDDSPANGSFDLGEEQPDITINLYSDAGCDGTGDVLISSQDTDINGEFLFTNVPVALAPAPPNPRMCYVVNYDTSDSDFDGCITPILPEEDQVELTTDTPDAPETVFGTTLDAQLEPIKIPTNSKLGLLLLISLFLVFAYRRNKLT